MTRVLTNLTPTKKPTNQKALCVSCVCFAQNMMTIHQKLHISGVYLDQVRLYHRREHACTVPVSLKYEATTLLTRVHTLSVLLSYNYDLTRPHFPRLRYESPYGLGIVLLFCREVLFPTTKVFIGCPLPLSITLTPLSLLEARKCLQCCSLGGSDVGDLGTLFSG